MNKLRMTLIGMLVMVTFVVAPVYAQDAATDTGVETQTTEPMDTEAQTGAEMGADQMSQPGAIRASHLMDKSVKDQQGNELGSISDVVISQEGKVDFIVLSEGGGILGTGDQQLKPVPWDKVQAENITEDQETITISVDQQKLKDAPAFSENEWQSFTQGEMDQQVRGYYESEGAQPDQMMEEPGMETQPPSDTQMEEPAEQPEGQY